MTFKPWADSVINSDCMSKLIKCAKLLAVSQGDATLSEEFDTCAHRCQNCGQFLKKIKTQ